MEPMNRILCTGRIVHGSIHWHIAAPGSFDDAPEPPIDYDDEDDVQVSDQDWQLWLEAQMQLDELLDGIADEEFVRRGGA